MPVYVDEIRLLSLVGSFPIILVAMLFLPLGWISLVGIAFWLLFPVLFRSYYYAVKPFKGELPPEFVNRKRAFLLKENLKCVENPYRCKLCHKHPVNKKYHLAKGHQISSSGGGKNNKDKENDISSYFVTCECNKCLETYDPRDTSA